MATEDSLVSTTSEETFDFVCTACDKENRTLEAVRYCKDCFGYCCQVCTDLHSRFPALQNHDLLDVGQGKQAGIQLPKLPEFSTERCSRHHEKVLDMFCEKHNEIGCSTCISEDHRACPSNQIHSIPAMIDSLYSLSSSKQVQTKLKEVIDSMTILIDSKNALLDRLGEVKNEALEKVTKFQKALEAVIKKVAEMSRKEIEDMHKKIEEEILSDKTDLKKTNDVLQVTSDKLNKADGNRAQSFVCTKIAEKKITETENELEGRNQNGNTDAQVYFTPNQSLMEYMNGLHGIGEVSVVSRQKKDLYKIVGRKDINIKVYEDYYTCDAEDCCLTHDNHFLVTDYYNQKLKRIDMQTLTVVRYCKLDSRPRGVCYMNEYGAVVACEGNKIQFVSIDGDKMKPTKQIKMSHHCSGIASKNDKLYVTDSNSTLYTYDMSGNLLEAVSQENAENKLLSNSKLVSFAENGEHMYVSDWDNGVVCFDGVGNHMSTFNDEDLRSVNGASVDGRGNIFTVGYKSHNVVQINENGKKIGVVINEGLQYPQSACFDKNLNRLFVTMYDSNVVKMYELE